jgi:hypothetical protein
VTAGFRDPPPAAAWRHRDAREGFEVAFIERAHEGVRVEGLTSGVEAGILWGVWYRIELDARWRTQRASLVSWTGAGRREVTLEAAAGRWTLDGAHAPELDGCVDVDLEASAFTNAFPVRRLGLEVGQAAEAPAAWVRLDPAVERLEQRYVRAPDDGERRRYAYAAPPVAFEAEIVYDASGLVLEYPGIAVRAA